MLEDQSRRAGRDGCDDTAGTFPTLNVRGRTGATPNEVSQAFIDYAAGTGGRVLDVGAAFGVASIPAVERGASVIANDIEPRHLTVLWERTPPELRRRLTLLPGRFPQELAFERESLDAVHASNVLNFLRGDEIEIGLRQVWRWLKPGGKVFSNSGTPYAGNIRNFIPIYEARKRQGLRWPGEEEYIQRFSSHPTVAELPGFLHLLDADVLRQAFESAGFAVVAAEMYLRKDLPDYLCCDGRENLGLIAVKASD
jgi:SAM-dependent methyltransferase